MSVDPLRSKSPAPRRVDVVYGQLLRIINTSCHPGDRLDSEVELTRSLGVSRASVREALAKLAAMGVVERRWGEGTFVAPVASHMVARLEELVPLSEIITRHGHSCEVEVVEVSQRAGPSPAHQYLEVALSRRVWSVTRVYIVDAQPALYVQDFVPDVVNDKIFDPSLVTQDLLPVLARDYGVAATHAVTTLEPARPSAVVARRLGISRATLLLRIRQTAFAMAPMQPVIYTMGLSHPKRFAYTTLRRSPSTFSRHSNHDLADSLGG